MSDVPKPIDGEILSDHPLQPYIPQYTERTPTLKPFVVPAIAAGAFLMVEWGTLRWMDHAPPLAWISTTAIGLCILIIVAFKDWLDFKNRRYFPVSLAILMIIWAGIVGFAYYWEDISSHEVDPAIAKLQSQLATAQRDRDLAILERDDARRANGIPISPPPQPPSPPIPKASDIGARIDAWRGIEAHMNEFNRILAEGDTLVSDWQSPQFGLFQKINELNNRLANARNRLSNFVSTYSDFSDLKVIDQSSLNRLSGVVNNLAQIASQLPPNISDAERRDSISAFISPLKRELEPAKKWVSAVKTLANSSISDLSARQSQNEDPASNGSSNCLHSGSLAAFVSN
ncbi:hypothetical protein [Bradyrhizobium sp.]|uniref:hypothetical protein n=1 Tax=Bradyrhizobium sp. TaxID=376 RepID=UPI0026117DA6|nr:hypothetical protein [Bradyrhizobium sp.]